MSTRVRFSRNEQNLSRLQSAELVIGMPCLNEADAIHSAIIRMDEALRRFFPNKKCVIIHCDASSPDQTRELFSRVPTETPKVSLAAPEGTSEEGGPLLHLFQVAVELGAEGIVVVDAEVQRFTHKWVHSLVDPLFNGYEYVSPIYGGHPCQWTVSNNIVYPLTRCLYGKRVREPTGGDFAISAGLARALLQEPWEAKVSGSGTNTWITTQAVISGRPICQSFLEGPRDLKDSDPPDRMPKLLLDNCRVLFSLVERCHEQWKDVKWSKPIPVFGLDEEEIPAPQQIEIRPEAYRKKFVEGFGRFDKTWRRILHQDLYLKIWEIQALSEETFEFPHLLWALILYDFALAYKRKTVEAETCLASLMPLYLGRVNSVARATARLTPREVEVYIEDQCRIFEETKPHLDRLWFEADKTGFSGPGLDR